jgi:competence protein ComEC
VHSCVLRSFAVSLTLVLASASVFGRSAKALQIYAIDVEGGQATLVVSPAGQSLLIDTGWPGFNGRDADRIVAAAHAAGLKRIDYVLITHHHRDHVGGVPQLVERIKVGTFVDHGPNLENSDVTRDDYAAYQKAIAGHPHIVGKPGMGLIALRNLPLRTIPPRTRVLWG